jgi:riboflavin synthase
MFTGIVEGLRRAVSVADAPERRRIAVDLGASADGIGVGASVAVNGCCLTVVALDGPVATFDLIAETLRKTAFGDLVAGDLVNVERCLRLGDRLDGHLVQGHVDGVGTLVAREDLPGETRLTVELPPDLAADPVVLKGSIALDGVSLTIAAVEGRRVTVCLIPHTLTITTLGRRRVGDRLHVETDVLGKMVRDLWNKRGGA